MYVYITSQNRVHLQCPIKNKYGDLKVALHELFFKVIWVNISEKNENNWVQVLDTHGNVLQTLTIPDGYYGFCDLKNILGEEGIVLKLNDANLRVSLTFTSPNGLINYNFAGPLAKMLGFETQDQVIYNFNVRKSNQSFNSPNPISLGLNSRLYVHLDRLKTSENLYDGQPSNILRILLSEKARYCDSESFYFDRPQYKKLEAFDLESLKLEITNENGVPVECKELLVVLEIK